MPTNLINLIQNLNEGLDLPKGQEHLMFEMSSTGFAEAISFAGALVWNSEESTCDVNNMAHVQEEVSKNLHMLIRVFRNAVVVTDTPSRS